MLCSLSHAFVWHIKTHSAVQQQETFDFWRSHSPRYQTGRSNACDHRDSAMECTCRLRVEERRCAWWWSFGKAHRWEEVWWSNMTQGTYHSWKPLAGAPQATTLSSVTSTKSNAMKLCNTSVRMWPLLQPKPRLVDLLVQYLQPWIWKMLSKGPGFWVSKSMSNCIVKRKCAVTL